MPVRETIGLTKDSLVRSIFIGADDMPPSPPEPPVDEGSGDLFYTLAFRFKSYPHWWGLDDTFADSTTLPRWFDSWSAFDFGLCAKLEGSMYHIEAGDINGFYTPGSHPPGYVGATPTALGDVGNGFTDWQYNDFSDILHSGDELAWISGNRLSGSTILYSDPYVIVESKIVESSDHDSVVHDFGTFNMVTKDNDLSGATFPDFPAADVYLGPTWTIP